VIDNKYIIKILANIIMAKVFKVYPKQTRNVNGVSITPEMVAIVTTKQTTLDPFSGGAVEIKNAFLDKYGVDIKKGYYTKNDFNVEILKEEL
jgi:hypothetical protein